MMLPKVRLVPLDNSGAFAVLLQTTPDGKDLEVVALGGGTTQATAKSNALHFCDALRTAVERIVIP